MSIPPTNPNEAATSINIGEDGKKIFNYKVLCLLDIQLEF